MGEGNAIPIIDGMREIAETSDAWLVDVWGVMHNGAEAFQAAVVNLANHGRYGEAMLTLERAIEANPRSVESHTGRGMARMRSKDPEGALRDFNRAAELDPEDAGMLYQLACIYALAGRTDQAITYLETWEKRGALPREWLENDSDLDSLRDQPRFQALMERL